jgi:hypothetical protein
MRTYQLNQIQQAASEGNFERVQVLLDSDEGLLREYLGEFPAMIRSSDLLTEAQMEEWDREFAERNPGACYEVSMNLTNHANAPKEQRTRWLFPALSQAKRKIELYVMGVWSDYCNGTGSGDAGYLEIELRHPDGTVEHIK